MKNHKLAVIPGDGTGPEVMREGVKVLKTACEKEKIKIDLDFFDYGGTRNLKSGELITEKDIEILKKYDAIYLGAIGHPDVKPGILEKGVLLRLRFDLDQYINLRPVKLFEGVETPLRDKGPKEIDYDLAEIKQSSRLITVIQMEAENDTIDNIIKYGNNLLFDFRKKTWHFFRHINNQRNKNWGHNFRIYGLAI